MKRVNWEIKLVEVPENYDHIQMIAKIQHFYDMLSERKKGCLADSTDLDVEEELAILISHFERIFWNLIYKSE